jgi:hypothetical protein
LSGSLAGRRSVGCRLTRCYLVGDQLAIYLDYKGSGLNTARFQGVLDSVQASYMDLFAFRDIFAKGVPIIGHCYDYAIPNNVHPICTPSAWLWPSISFAGYDYNEGLNIISQMIGGFYTMLSKLAADPKNNFIVFEGIAPVDVELGKEALPALSR